MKRSTLRRWGIISIVVGVTLIAFGLNQSTTQVFNCPANGCPQSVLWAAFLGWAIPFFLGLSLTVSGVVILLVSRLTLE